jgi:hypothetical protein
MPRKKEFVVLILWKEGSLRQGLFEKGRGEEANP